MVRLLEGLENIRNQWNICEQYDLVIEEEHLKLVNGRGCVENVHRDKRCKYDDDLYYFDSNYVNNDIIQMIVLYLDYIDIINLCIVSERFTRQYWNNGNHQLWKSLYLKDISDNIFYRKMYTNLEGETKMMSYKKKYINLMIMYDIELTYETTNQIFSEKNVYLLYIIHKCKAEKMALRFVQNFSPSYITYNSTDSRSSYHCIKLFKILFKMNCNDISINILNRFQLDGIDMMNCIDCAVRVGNMTIIDYLITIGYSDYENIILLSAKYAREDIFKAMMSRHEITVLSNNIVSAALFNLSRKRNIERCNIIEFLLQNGFKDYERIITFASEYGHTDVIKLMINNGYDNFDLITRIVLKHIPETTCEIIQLLLDHGLNDYNNILCRAARYGLIDTVKLILSKGATEINMATSILINEYFWFDHPLKHVMYKETLKVLLDNGANDFETFMKYVLRNNRMDLFDTLVETYDYDLILLAIKNYGHYRHHDIIINAYIKNAHHVHNRKKLYMLYNFYIQQNDHPRLLTIKNILIENNIPS